MGGDYLINNHIMLLYPLLIALRKKSPLSDEETRQTMKELKNNEVCQTKLATLHYECGSYCLLLIQ